MRRAHSARPWLGDNAIHGAGEVLDRLRQYEPRQPWVDGLQYREGLNAVGIRGGVAGNVIPDEASTLALIERLAQDPAVAQLVEALGARVAKGEDFVRVHGGKSIAIGRFVPGVKSVVPGVVGMLGMNQAFFVIVNVSSAIVWAFVLTRPVQIGEAAFGQPSRITARARLGRGEVVDIEREVELGGPLHSKGVLILSSFLASRYARLRPYAIGASLVFEQTYGMVEGDSASLAELCALLSDLADAPIRQSLAVTGSVNPRRGRNFPLGGQVDRRIPPDRC